MRGDALVDGRNLLDPASVRAAGLRLRRRRSPLMATVLVAGGAGFIGSHLVDRLLDRGDRVVCVDDLSTGRSENVAHLDGTPLFRFVRPRRGPDDLADVLDGEQFDVVWHLASPASPPAYLRPPDRDARRPARSARTTCSRSHAVHDARFFLASTSEVYGDPLVHPQTESYWGNVNPIGERSVYDEAKRFAEAITMAYHRAVRPGRCASPGSSTPTGPRMRSDDGRVVTNFVQQALAGEPLTVYGDGAQTRSFCYVDDEVTGLLALVDGDCDRSGQHRQPARGDDAGVGTGRHRARRVELDDRASAAARRRPPGPARPTSRSRPRQLGWAPTVSLRDGLARMIDDHRTRA